MHRVLCFRTTPQPCSQHYSTGWICTWNSCLYNWQHSFLRGPWFIVSSEGLSSAWMLTSNKMSRLCDAFYLQTLAFKMYLGFWDVSICRGDLLEYCLAADSWGHSRLRPQRYPCLLGPLDLQSQTLQMLDIGESRFWIPWQVFGLEIEDIWSAIGQLAWSEVEVVFQRTPSYLEWIYCWALVDPFDWSSPWPATPWHKHGRQLRPETGKSAVIL